VDIFTEKMYQEGRDLAVSGEFTLVSVDEEGKPVSIK
jgi:acyl-CoA hydrolase